MPQLYLLFV